MLDTLSACVSVRVCVCACVQVAGSLGAECGLVLPYRGQKEPQFPSDDELASIPEGYPRLVAMRSFMTAGTTSLVPSPHAGLGLEAYVQVVALLPSPHQQCGPT